MANIKSAQKRVQVSERNRLRNKAHKSVIRTLMKRYFGEVAAYQAEPTPEAMAQVQKTMSEAYCKIDKAVKGHVYHANNAARKKARMAKALKSIDLKEAA